MDHATTGAGTGPGTDPGTGPGPASGTSPAGGTPSFSAVPTTRGRRRCPAWVPALVLALTVGQLLLGTFATGLEQFADKAFGARLVTYPLLMLAAPAAWWLTPARRRGEPPPWGPCSLVMLPFLVDVTGNTLDLYDTVGWWDDANHLVNWFLLCSGLGLLCLSGVRPPWAVVLAVTGLGALLAIGWELGEWFTFIRHGTELDTAYTDTLGDEALGTLGALAAGLLVGSRAPRAGLPRRPPLED